MTDRNDIPRVWLMICDKGWYPIEPSEKCKPEDHGNLNDHVNEIKDAMTGETLWKRAAQ